MPMVNAACTGCGAALTLDDSVKVSFCMYCGARFLVSDGVENYIKRNPNALSSPDADIDSGDGSALDKSSASGNKLGGEFSVGEVDALLEKGSFSRAEDACRTALDADPENWGMLWRLLLAETRKLEPIPLDSPADFLWDDFNELFRNAPADLVSSWRETYYSAYINCISATADSYNPHVFLETSVYKWNKKANDFEHPVDKNYDIDAHLNKTIRKRMNSLSEVLSPDVRDQANDITSRVCEKIKAAFFKGFTNIDAIHNNDFSKLLGVWAVKHSGEDMKTEIIRFLKNSMGVICCEHIRTKVSSLDHFRFVSMTSLGSLTCTEIRRFPSRSGIGGDFTSITESKSFQSIVAVYDFLLILPNGVFARMKTENIPGYDAAIVFAQKCYVAPCFIRTGNKDIQMLPIAEVYNTSTPTKRTSACYIATAVYGDENERHVLALRRFRDDVLHRSRIGRLISCFYYRNSPPVAEKLKNARFINSIVRSALNLFVFIINRGKNI